MGFKEGGLIGATIPGYEVAPGTPPSARHGISDMTACVLVPKERVEALV